MQFNLLRGTEQALALTDQTEKRWTELTEVGDGNAINHTEF